ncbi:sigma-70 family RNA polymerase sigma factor [Phenylobacterium sp.]|jgi:RNA polymerase sigma-70 factor (ECF subfamily)|uniref:sigma-70 family RNA polymerase sigma factor n=1 Tax=Phenylobacterium sp. TaxID=1871053 RepID=UPI0037C8851C
MQSVEAWREAIVGQIPALRAFAWSLCRNGADADDLVQDALVKAWANRHRFQVGTNLRAWLFTILRNTWYTQVVRRRRETPDPDGAHAETQIVEAGQPWSVAMTAMRAALQELPEDQREAIILVGAAGLSYEEAAEVCGCALGTIKSRVNRARTRLAILLDAESAAEMAGRPAPAARGLA